MIRPGLEGHFPDVTRVVFHMFEKNGPGPAELASSGIIPVGGPAEPGAVPLTKGPPPAKPALGVDPGLHLSKSLPRRTAPDRLERVFDEISQSPLRVNEKVARITVAVMFDQQVRVASIQPAAGRFGPVKPIYEDIFEQTNRYRGETVLDPEIENGRVESPQIFTANRVRRGPARFQVLFQAGNEL